MLFRLCQALSVPHPDFLTQVLTTRQIEDWVAFWELEPWGTPADDLRFAQLTWATFQTSRKQRLSVATFLPKWGSNPTSALSYKERQRLAIAAAEPKSRNV